MIKMLPEITNEELGGISQQEALNRLKKYGHNELKSESSNSLLKIVLAAIKEPMVLLLFGIGLIYFILGEFQEVYSLLTFLCLILGITVYQEHKTEKTLHALRELSSPRAVAIREKKQIRIPGRDIVPDDIVILNEGDRVPADILLLRGGPLSLDESIITGESFPAVKSSSEHQTILSGTLVLNGQALGKVIHTGQNTELGKIGKSIGKTEVKGTSLQKTTRRIVKNLSLLVGSLTLFIIIFYWLTRDDLIEGILVGLTLAMAILPNELPAVLLIFLAAGAWRISRRNVLTRKVPAIEALGGITYLCVDKTGTLTQNNMILKTIWNGEERLDIVHLNQSLPEHFHEVLEFGILATPQNPFDPMEKALQVTGNQFLNKTEHLHPNWKLSKEYQISTELLAVSYAWKNLGNNEHIIGAKGATEAIIDLCHLSPDRTKQIENEMLQMSINGLRVIAVAKAFATLLPDNQHDLKFDFLGLLGFEDPIREDAADAIRECQEAGVKVLMMTGDHPATAMSIAKQIGLHNNDKALTGNDINLLNDESLLAKLKEVQIFCRMKPLDKLRIVEFLQTSGEIVAMTGDGVNDAPALKKAQIGIAMGKRGTDVAREAASVVLLDDSFSSIVAAIRTGRRIFENLQKAFSYLLSIHIPITVLSIVPVIFQLPLILLPVHIAFLHLIIEPASTTLFEALPADINVMKKKPRSKNNHLLSGVEIKRSIVSGIIISIAGTIVFVLAINQGLKASDARGITFTTLIICNLCLIYIMNDKHTNDENKSHFKILVTSTLALLILVLYVPFFRELFRFEPLHLHDLIPCIFVSALTSILMIPLYKKTVSWRRHG